MILNRELIAKSIVDRFSHIGSRHIRGNANSCVKIFNDIDTIAMVYIYDEYIRIFYKISNIKNTKFLKHCVDFGGGYKSYKNSINVSLSDFDVTEFSDNVEAIDKGLKDDAVKEQ